MLRKIQKKTNPVDAQVSRRNLLKRGSLLGGLTAFLSTFSLVPMVNEVHAAAPPEKWTITPIQGTQADEYIHTVLTSPDYKDFQKLAQAQGAPALPGSQLSVNLFTQGQTKFVYVSDSVRRGDEYSTYTAFFQPGSFTPTQVNGYLFVLIPGQSNMAVIGKTNGQEVFNAVITPSGKVVKGYKITADGKNVTLDGLDLSQRMPTKASSGSTVGHDSCCQGCCLWNCFASVGNIPAGVLQLAAEVCGGACLIAATCIPCLLALGTIGNVAVAYCDSTCCW